MKWTSSRMKSLASFLSLLSLCSLLFLFSYDGLSANYNETVSVSQKSKVRAKKGKKRSIKKKIRKPKRVKTQVALIDGEDSV